MQLDGILTAIGNTPLVQLGTNGGMGACILAKLEFLNPGSIKDRMATFMLGKAEARGEVTRGGVIVEATTGNTGIALAMIAAARGYKMIAVMPYGLSAERTLVMEALGADVIVLGVGSTPADAIAERDAIASRTPDAWVPDQFANPENSAAHEATTGREIVEQTGGRVDAFVAGVGTGGTLMGVARALRRVNPDVRVVAVEPAESAVMSGGQGGSHGIEGIGEGFIPPLVDLGQITDVVVVSTQEAKEMARRLALEYGLLVGVSSGANFAAARQIARKLDQGKVVVTVLPDRGERYLSCNLYAPACLPVYQG